MMTTSRTAVVIIAVATSLVWALIGFYTAVTAAPAHASSGTVVQITVPDEGVTVNITAAGPVAVYIVPSAAPTHTVLIPSHIQTAPTPRASTPAPTPRASTPAPTPRASTPAPITPSRHEPVQAPPATSTADATIAPIPSWPNPPAPTQAPPTSSSPAPSPTGQSLPEPHDPDAEQVTRAPAATPGTHSPVGNESGLPWKSGVFSHDAEKTTRYEQALGRKVDIISVAVTRDSWDEILNPWWLNVAPQGYQGVLEVGVPLWPEDGNVDAAAAGDYNAEWAQLGRMLEERYPGSSVRIGWEFNLSGWDHAANEDNLDRWVPAFQNASRSLKQGGPSLQVVWGPNGGIGDGLSDATRAWPGDQYVDIVGMSYYDWWPPLDSHSYAQERFDGPYDLRFWIDFARKHHKPFEISEAGVAPGNSQGGGDNPVYIDEIMGLFRETEEADPGRIHALVYFDEPDAYIANSIANGQVPAATAALTQQMDETEKQFRGGLPGRAAPVATATAEPSTTPEPSATHDTQQWVRPENSDHGPIPAG